MKIENRGLKIEDRNRAEGEIRTLCALLFAIFVCVGLRLSFLNALRYAPCAMLFSSLR